MYIPDANRTQKGTYVYAKTLQLNPNMDTTGNPYVIHVDKQLIQLVFSGGILSSTKAYDLLMVQTV